MKKATSTETSFAASYKFSKIQIFLLFLPKKTEMDFFEKRFSIIFNTTYY